MKNHRFLVMSLLVTAILLAACGGGTPAAEPTTAAQPPTVAQPTAPLPTETSVEPQPAEATQTQYAPFCGAAPTACEAPTVTLLDPKYCVEKVPYVLLSVPPGTTYESMDPDLECKDQLNSDGTLRVTCHSITNKELISYDLKLCSGACSAPALQTGTGQCPEGYGFDAANQCCAAPAPASSDGCTTYKIDIRTCPNP